MKKIVIIGGGFAGLFCAKTLSVYSKKLDLDVVLIDKSGIFNFLPALPDIIGRRIKPDHLINEIKDLSERFKFRFISDTAVALDLDNNKVQTQTGFLDYDYLVIASGSETNFYGNDIIRKHAYKLDDASDAEKLIGDLEGKEHYLIAGGGYTGIELATNLRVYLDRKRIQKKIYIVERAPSILGPLPQWMKEYVLNNLKKLDIEVFTNISVGSIEQDKINLSNGNSFDKAMLIWAAGVRTADFIQNLKVDKNPQGRIKVDDYLRVKDNCFVIGDAGYFSYNGNFLRMAVQFAITQGVSAALNISRSIRGLNMVQYKPIDLGFVIPMANNKSCADIMGINMKGFIPTCLHYIMCIYRSYGVKNKFGIIRDLMS